jgi:hypothetical protein
MEQFRIRYADFDVLVAQARAATLPRPQAVSAQRFAEYRDQLVDHLPGTWKVRTLDLPNDEMRYQAAETLWLTRDADPYGTMRRTLRAASLQNADVELVLLQDAAPSQRLTIAPLHPSWQPVKGWCPPPPPAILAPAGPDVAAGPRNATPPVIPRMPPPAPPTGGQGHARGTR